MPKLPTNLPLRGVFLRGRPHPQAFTQIRSSSGTTSDPDSFNRTGTKPASDPAAISMTSDENSKSGGDDVVAEQSTSYQSQILDVKDQKDEAGKGNEVNPLEVSPANREVSKMAVEQVIETEEGVRTSKRISFRGAAVKGKEVGDVVPGIRDTKVRGR